MGSTSEETYRRIEEELRTWYELESKARERYEHEMKRLEEVFRPHQQAIEDSERFAHER